MQVRTFGGFLALLASVWAAPLLGCGAPEANAPAQEATWQGAPACDCLYRVKTPTELYCIQRLSRERFEGTGSDIRRLVNQIPFVQVDDDWGSRIASEAAYYDPGLSLLLLDRQKEVRGVSIVARDEPTEHSPKASAYLAYFAIDTAIARNKLGSALMKATLVVANASGLEAATWQTPYEDQAANAFYASFGAEVRSTKFLFLPSGTPQAILVNDYELESLSTGIDKLSETLRQANVVIIAGRLDD